MKYIFLSLLSLLLFFFGSAQSDDAAFIKSISDNILTSKSSYNNLHHLTKKVGARLAGSKQMVMAEQWGYKALQAAGADTVYFQECRVPVWQRGGTDKAHVVTPKGKRPLQVVALGNTLGSGKAGVKAPVVVVKNWADLEARKDNIKGKIVFYSVGFDERHVRTFQAYSESVQYRGAGASRAAKYGAVAVIVRSMSHSNDNFPHTGSVNYNDSFPKIPAVAIGLRDAAYLDSFASNSNTVVELFTYGRTLPDTIGNNVIAELKGTLHPEKIITLGGHLDSWDNCEGAHDDGAGIVQTIEVLRAFKELGYRPKHTIRFVFFANEENGLRGGRKYAEEAKRKNEQHVFALESDAGGFTPRGFSFSGPESSWSKLLSWKELLAPYYGDQFSKGGGGADIGPLARTMNVPVAGLLPDSQRYFDVHHAANDTFESVNFRELNLGAINMAALVYLVDQYGL